MYRALHLCVSLSFSDGTYLLTKMLSRQLGPIVAESQDHSIGQDQCQGVPNHRRSAVTPGGAGLSGYNMQGHVPQPVVPGQQALGTQGHHLGPDCQQQGGSFSRVYR